MPKAFPDYTKKDLENMSLEEAERVLGNAVYVVGCFYEQLEHAGKVHGNGHHMAQNLAAMSAKPLRDQWNDKDEVEALNKKSPLRL